MLVTSPLLRHPSEFSKPDPALRFEKNECFIEDQLLEYWLVSYALGRRARGQMTPYDFFLPFIRDPWEVEEVAELMRHAIANRTVRVNPSHEPGALFIMRGNGDRFFVYEVIGEGRDSAGYPAFFESVQELILHVC